MTPNEYAELTLALQDARLRIDRALTLLARELPRIDEQRIVATGRTPAEANVRYMGTKLRRWRKGNDLTLRQVSNITKLSQAYLSDLERGKLVNPSMKTVQAIARAMGVEPSELFPS